MNNLLFIGHPRETHLALFAGGELGPLARWRIEQHLEKCSACQDVVADFFHLHSDVSELAQLPQLDWNEFAQDIAARVRLETPDPAETKSGWFAHPWQLGLATAALLCTIVVVRQLPTVREGLREEAPLVLSESNLKSKAADRMIAMPSQLAPEAQPEANSPVSDRSEFEQRAATSAAPPMTELGDAAPGAAQESAIQRFNEARDDGSTGQLSYAVPARRDEDLRMQPATPGALAPDIAAAAPPSDQKASAVSNSLLTERAKEVASSEPAQSREVPGALEDAAESSGRAQPEQLARAADAQPAAPPAPTVVAAQERDSNQRQELRAQQSVIAGNAGAAESNAPRKTEQAPLAQAKRPLGVASLGAFRGQQKTLEKKADADEAFSRQRGFTVLPASLEDPTVDVGVAADGWISVRSVDANTGTITITDVYVP